MTTMVASRRPLPTPAKSPGRTWPDLLSTGEVETVFQTHALAVTFRMKDRSNIGTTEPGIDAIFRLVDEWR